MVAAAQNADSKIETSNQEDIKQLRLEIDRLTDPYARLEVGRVDRHNVVTIFVVLPTLSPNIVLFPHPTARH